MNKRGVGLAAVFTFMLAGCGSGGGNLFIVSASVKGLTAGQVVLQNNSGDDLTVTADGKHDFPTLLIYGGQYDLTVKTQPANLICVADSPVGTVISPVTIDVVCTTPVAVSGTLETSTDGSFLGNVTIEARNPVDDSVLSSTVTETGLTGTLGHYSINVPNGHDFYLHAAGRDIEGTTYVSDNLQIENETADRSSVKFYFTDQTNTNTVATNLGFDSAKDAIFSMDVEDSSSNGVAGVTVSASPAVSNILYKQDAAGTYSATGPSTTYNSVMGNLTDPGKNGTYTFTLSPDKTSGGAYDYTIDQTFRLRLIPGELSSPIEP